MNTPAKIVLLVTSVLAGGLFPDIGYAYEPETTHAGLTQEIIKLFEKKSGRVITEEERVRIIDGSINEDFPEVRSLSHFFDPVRDMGFNNGTKAKDWALGVIDSNEYSWPKIIQYYAEGDENKAYYGLGHILHLIEDMTVPDHTRNDPHKGNGLDGLYTGDSPYESWTSENKDRKSLVGLAVKIQTVKKFSTLNEYFDFLAGYSNGSFFSRDTIEGKTFQYRNPVVVEFNEKYAFGIDALSAEKSKLYKVVDSQSDKNHFERVLMDDFDKSILSEYFDRLSVQAVSAGAGVMDLFFKEANIARENYRREKAEERARVIEEQEELAKVLSEKSSLGLVVAGFGFLVKDTARPVIALAGNVASTFASGFKKISQDGPALARIGLYSGESLASALGGEVKTVAGKALEGFKILAENDAVSFTQKLSGARLLEMKNTSVDTLAVESSDNLSMVGTSSGEDLIIQTEKQDSSVKNGVSVSQEAVLAKQTDSVPTPISVSGMVSGFGGGGSLSSNSASVSTNSTTDTVAPNTPVIITPATFSETFRIATITFSGTAEAGSTVSNNLTSATTVVDALGNWSLGVLFGQGTTSINFFATDSAGNRSAGQSKTLFVDSLSPAIAVSVSECDNSMSGEGCLLSSGVVHVSWSSVDSDLSYFSLNENGSVRSTSATSTTITIASGDVYNFEISAVDTSGNASATSTKVVEVSQNPVVISEVAWAGTAASSADEWIELYNRTDKTISLTDFILYTDTGSPFVYLSGEVGAGGYYLIERKNTGETNEATESPIKDITADLWVSFGSGLRNTGEHLVLARKPGGQATTTIDEIAFCVNWCGKGSSADNSYSMERYNPEISGTDWLNWGSSLSILGRGRDVNSGVINATPRVRNSVSYLINKGSNVSADLTLEREMSPYIVNGITQTVNVGATLNVEPGVVIKFVGDSGLNVYGNLVANGTAELPIVFTSFLDDDYDGDTNGNGTSTLPVAGSWFGVKVLSDSLGSSFSNTIFRYGGKYYSGVLAHKKANLYIEETSPIVRDSIFEHSKVYGLSLSGSDSQVTNNTFRYCTSDTPSIGITVVGGSPNISGNTIVGNSYGVVVSSVGGTFANNQISSSTSYAMSVSGSPIPEMSGNSGTQNGTNGIIISGNISSAGATSTLKQNSLPYVVSSASGPPIVPSGSGAVIEAGTTLKFNGAKFQVNGGLSIAGTEAAPVVFTSIYDDSDGNDATNDGSAHSPAVSGLQGVYFYSGSYSSVENARFSYMKKALSFTGSVIDLFNVTFDNNDLGVEAFIGEPIIRATNLIFTNNLATSTISLIPN